MAIEKKRLIDMLRMMLRIRHFEERTAKEFAAGGVPGWVHLYIGQEAIAVGTCANLRVDDYITSNHRGHGHVIAKGGKVELMMAELYGRRTGYCKGKGGSMHIADIGIGVLGANAIVGAGIPIATGAALSAKMRGTDQVAVCFFSDGASNTARFHEGINLGSIWKLPVIYIVENNQWATRTNVSKSMNIVNIADRAASYGIPGVIVDGNDVIAVYEAAGDAIARARKGEGPSLLECKTCRQRGHNEGDPQEYRDKGDIEECCKKDPIKRFRERLIQMKMLTDEKANEIAQEIIEEIDSAVKVAVKDPIPDPEETLEDVYA